MHCYPIHVLLGVLMWIFNHLWCKKKGILNGWIMTSFQRNRIDCFIITIISLCLISDPILETWFFISLFVCASMCHAKTPLPGFWMVWNQDFWSKMPDNNPKNQKKLGAFFANVFWCHILYWSLFHKHDIYNFIYMNIHMEKTYRALQCQKCGKYFKKK